MFADFTARIFNALEMPRLEQPRSASISPWFEVLSKFRCAIVFPG
jgi:hypothetical protein